MLQEMVVQYFIICEGFAVLQKQKEKFLVLKTSSTVKYVTINTAFLHGTETI